MITTYENLNILQALPQAGLNILLKAVKEANLDSVIESADNITVFAPDDNAFNKLEGFISESLLKPENKEKLADILKYHLVSSAMPADAVESIDSIEMMNGKKADIFRQNCTLMINDARITGADIKVKNGIIHKINKVLLPG